MVHRAVERAINGVEPPDYAVSRLRGPDRPDDDLALDDYLIRWVRTGDGPLDGRLRHTARCRIEGMVGMHAAPVTGARAGRRWAGASADQAPSLPRGGGAIRDIGEKFTTDPANGTGSMEVPIATSPGGRASGRG